LGGVQNRVDSQPGFDSNTGGPVVTFRFDAAGAKRFGKVTQENVGLPFAIVLDGKVISAPVIREPILGGQGQISGSFTVESANDLAILLRAGALPPPPISGNLGLSRGRRRPKRVKHLGLRDGWRAKC